MSAIKEALRIAAKTVNRTPTEAQKESGNYAKGHLRLHGLEIAIENPKGGERSGVDRGGKPWRVRMPAHYGYVKGTEGKDGDHVDVYVGPNHASGKVFVVDQIDAETGRFDEHKAMLSYGSKTDALADYQKAFSDGKAKDRIGAVTEMTTGEFKSWVKSGATKRPLGDLRKSYADGGAVMPAVSEEGARSMPPGTESWGRAIADRLYEFGASQPDTLMGNALSFGANALAEMPETLVSAHKLTRAPSQLWRGEPLDAGLVDVARVGSVAMPLARPLAPLVRPLPSLGRISVDRTGAAEHRIHSLLRELETRGAGTPYASGGVVDMSSKKNAVSHGLDVARRMRRASGGRASYADGGSPDLDSMYGFGVGDDAAAPVRATADEEAARLGRQARAGLASSVDPFGIPSAITGLVSPQTRDAWRDVQSSEGLVPQIAGSLAGGVGGFGLAMKGAKGVADRLARSMSIGAGSDVVDRVAGEDSLDATTAGKALLGAFGQAPGKIANAAIGAGGLSLLTPFGEAKAAAGPLSPDEAARRKFLQEKGNTKPGLNKREREELIRYDERASAAAGAEMSARQEIDKERIRAEIAAEKEKTAEERRVAAELKGKLYEDQKAASDRATDAYAKTRGERHLAQTPFEETWWGRTFNPTMTPAILGALSGVLLGGKGAAGARANAKGWQKALDDLAKAKTPSASLDAAAIAKSYANDVFPAGASAAKGYGMPMVLGATEGVGGTFLPNYWDRNLPERNIERTAIEAALAELPPEHPDRARYESRINDPDAPGYAPPRTPAKVDAEAKPFLDLLTEAGGRAAIGASAGAMGKTMGSLPSPSYERIARLRADTGRSGIKPKAVETEGTRMLGVNRADADFASANRTLEEADRLGSVAHRQRLDALAEIEATGLPPAAKQALIDDILGSGAPPRPRRPVEVDSSPSVISPSADSNQRVAGKRSSSKKSTPKPLTKSELVSIKDALEGRRLPGIDLDILPKKDGGEVAGPAVFLRTKHPAGHWQTRSVTGKFASGGAISAAIDKTRLYAHGGAVRVGPIVGATGGRADKLPVSVPSGAFVMPADVVAGLGEGNSMAGMKRLEETFGKATPRSTKAGGGAAVPIKISDGEFVLSPEQVAQIGGGDMAHGHKILDSLVLKLRDEHIKTLASLPPPSK